MNKWLSTMMSTVLMQCAQHASNAVAWEGESYAKSRFLKRPFLRGYLTRSAVRVGDLWVAHLVAHSLSLVPEYLVRAWLYVFWSQCCCRRWSSTEVLNNALVERCMRLDGICGVGRKGGEWSANELRCDAVCVRFMHILCAMSDTLASWEDAFVWQRLFSPFSL